MMPKKLKIMMEQVIDQNSMALRELLLECGYEAFEPLLERYFVWSKAEDPMQALDGQLAGFGLSIIFRDILAEIEEHD